MTPAEVTFPFRARFFMEGEISARTRSVWFVLHGYGQLAAYFIRKFGMLPQHDICVIAPEGLSTFYREDFKPGSGRGNDRVGATWMTKENRLMDIANYVNYLNTVYDQSLKGKNLPVTVLGFSQGAATATRWVLDNKIEFQRLILWSGMFPPDIDFSAGRELLASKTVTLVYGKQDPFLTDDRFREMHDLSSRISDNIREVSFDGGHDIDEETLLKIMDRV